MARVSEQDSAALRRFKLPLILLAAILVCGTLGYWFIGGGNYSINDALYMTVITIATIGYAEVIDLSHSPGGRIFTMFVAFFGIGVLAYIMSSFTALIVEGELTQSFRRRRMERSAGRLKGHYIVCGRGTIGVNVIDELKSTGRNFVVIDPAEDGQRDEIFVRGDASDNAVLEKAGIHSAAGLFALTSDDNINVVVSLSARQLNPNVRIVARCGNTANIEKLKKAGADAVVSPSYIGGLRMASEMIRPTAVSFLDTMLRDSQVGLRVEEAAVPAAYAGKALSDLKLKKFPSVLLLAVKSGDGWVYAPPETRRLERGDTLVFMTTPGERLELDKMLEEA